MLQVLFRIPFPWWGSIPIYGFGTMLVVAMFLGIFVACRRARQNDVNPEIVQDAAFWMVIAGIIGARLVFMIQFHNEIKGNWFLEFFTFWKGGLVWYGSLVGGLAGYILNYWWFVSRKQSVSFWKLADIIVPSVALGLCIGRFGCLLNGCCYGGEALPGLPALHFPANSYAGKEFINDTAEPTKAAGFRLDPEAEDRRTVAWVDPRTDAAKTGGLRPGDVIVKMDGWDLPAHVGAKGVFKGLTQTEVIFTVERAGKEVTLPAFEVETQRLPPDWPDDLAGLGIRIKVPPGPEGLLVVEVLADGLAASSGVQKGDLVRGRAWDQKPKDELTLTVLRDGQEVALAKFNAQTVGLHPTQIYESISTLLMFLVMTVYFPLRKRDGEILVLFLIAYPLHRFLNEMLRSDTQPVALGMTLSQNISLMVFVAALALAVWLVRRPVQYPSRGENPSPKPSPSGTAASAVR